MAEPPVLALVGGRVQDRPPCDMSEVAPRTSSVCRYADVFSELRDPVGWSSANSVFGDNRLHAEFPAVITLDGSDHARVRRVLVRGLDRVAIVQALAGVEPAVVEAVARAAALDAVDGIAAIARPIAVATAAAVLGVELPASLPSTTAAVVGAMGRDGAPCDGDAAAVAAYQDALPRLHRWALAAIRDGQAQGVVAIVRAALRRRELSLPEAVSNVVLLAIAGVETTTGLLGGLVWHYAQLTTSRARLTVDPRARARFVEEVARLESPSDAFYRLGTGGGTVHRLQIGAANRDARAFANPHALDLDRDGPGHLAFGWGSHHCLGAGVARGVADALLRTLLPYEAALPARVDRDWRPYPMTRQLSALEVSLRRAPIADAAPPESRRWSSRQV